MKMNGTFAVKIGAVIVLGLIVVGCGVQDFTIKDRIDEFESDINGNLDGVYKNFDSDKVGMYSQIKDEAFWTAYFPQTQIYSISNVSVSGNSATATISGGVYDNNEISWDFVDRGDGGAFGGEEYYMESMEMEMDVDDRLVIN